MDEWQQLITTLQDLNDRAGLIQGYRADGNAVVVLNDATISQIVGDYVNWYTECLTRLPEDLRERFRKVHESRINYFLMEPTETILKEEYYEDRYLGAWPHFKHDYKEYFEKPLFTHRQVLLEASKRQPIIKKPSAIEIIEYLGRRFDLVVRQLQRRHQNRETLRINDEYDVQDLFHSLLRLSFDDIRPEEWTPSYAGRSARVDFLLKQEEIVIEIKKTRETLRAKEVGEELIIDKERYRGIPNCKTLIAFIYDPDKYIDNPKGLETDLSESGKDMLIKVIIAPD
jgi:hypothetical protein